MVQQILCEQRCTEEKNPNGWVFISSDHLANMPWYIPTGVYFCCLLWLVGDHIILMLKCFEYCPWLLPGSGHSFRCFFILVNWISKYWILFSPQSWYLKRWHFWKFIIYWKSKVVWRSKFRNRDEHACCVCVECVFIGEQNTWQI